MGRQKENQELSCLIKLLPHKGAGRMYPYSASVPVVWQHFECMLAPQSASVYSFSKHPSVFNKIQLNY